MKQKFFDALKAKFSGVSDAILNRVADKLAKTVTSEDQVASAVEGVTFQQVLESYGDSRATEAQQTAVKNYEAKFGLKDGVKVQTAPAPAAAEPQGNKSGDDVPAWAKALIDSNQKITSRLDAFEQGKKTDTRKQQLSVIVGRLPESLRQAYERTPVDNLSDEEFATLSESITKEVEGIIADTQAKGAVFGRPLGGSKQQPVQSATSAKEATDAEASAVVDKLNF